MAVDRYLSDGDSRSWLLTRNDEPVLYRRTESIMSGSNAWYGFAWHVLCRKIGIRYLMDTANKVYLSHSEIQGREITRLAAYGVFAVYGFSVSAGINVFWYSLIRRIKSHNMWSDSFLHWLVSSFGKAVHFVSSHRNSAVSSLIPYNLFLLANLAGILATYLLRGKGVWWLLPAFAAVILDGIVGVLKFKQKAEQIDIVRESAGSVTEKWITNWMWRRFTEITARWRMP